jgi:hypothetical protein
VWNYQRKQLPFGSPFLEDDSSNNVREYVRLEESTGLAAIVIHANQNNA